VRTRRKCESAKVRRCESAKVRKCESAKVRSQIARIILGRTLALSPIPLGFCPAFQLYQVSRDDALYLPHRSPYFPLALWPSSFRRRYLSREHLVVDRSPAVSSKILGSHRCPDQTHKEGPPGAPLTSPSVLIFQSFHSTHRLYQHGFQSSRHGQLGRGPPRFHGQNAFRRHLRDIWEVSSETCTGMFEGSQWH
jgi:hypothetical protein